MALAAVSRTIHHGMFSHPAYMPLGTVAGSHPGSFFHLSDGTIQHAPGSTSAAYQTSHEWQAAHHMGFPNTASDASMGGFGYASYGDHHQGTQAGSFPTSFHHGFVSPSNFDHAMSYAYDWNAHDAQETGHGPGPSSSGTAPGSTLVSPTEAGAGARTPGSFTSTSSGGQYSSMYTGASNSHMMGAQSGSGSTLTPGRGRQDSGQANKKGKGKGKSSESRQSSKKSKLGSAPSSSTFASSSGESSRSGAASSARGSHSPASSRKSQATTGGRGGKKAQGGERDDMNYRVRLNAGFENLTKALPAESLRSPARVLGHISDASASTDVAEKKPSKQELLELARLHIHQLEERRDALARERKELIDTRQRLQAIHDGQFSSHGRAAGGEEFDEEDEEDDDDDDDDEE